MLIIHVVGARPNFMKVAPVIQALRGRMGISQLLVHTGQHYDANMSQIFFNELGLPEPDVNLEVGSASHAVQTAEIMVKFEQVLQVHRPDWVLVYGDVNSTVAAAMVSAKLGVRVAHVEAGLRSFDRRMPEEINRLVTDQLSDLLFTPSADGNANLEREGIPAAKIKLVGNVMIDTLVRLLPKAEARAKDLRRRFNAERYGLVTLHRPSNVDETEALTIILETLNDIGHDLQLLFPIHPRTRQRVIDRRLSHLTTNIEMIDPVGYLDFLALQRHATLIITDSGGIQEESTFLGVPCLTVRENTERPVTVTTGTNTLVYQDMNLLRREVDSILHGHGKQGKSPPLWDGRAGERIADVLLRCRPK